MTDLIDGNVTDLWSIGVAAGYAFFRACRHRKCRPAEKLFMEWMYGLSLFPMFLLFLSVFSSQALEMLMSSNKILMSGAGLLSLVVLIRRNFEREAFSPYDSRF